MGRRRTRKNIWSCLVVFGEEQSSHIIVSGTFWKNQFWSDVWKREEVSGWRDFIHLPAGIIELQHIQTQRNNMCEDIVVLSIPGRLMTSPAAHMPVVFVAFPGAANSTHTLSERSPSSADHGRDSKCFHFEKATPQTASCDKLSIILRDSAEATCLEGCVLLEKNRRTKL